MGTFCLYLQISAKIRGGKGLGIRCAYIVTQSCSSITEDHMDFATGKESSKGEVKIGTTPSFKKDGKAIKVFPGW